MILAKPEILKELRRKSIRISPLGTKSVGPASVDLSLGNKIRVFSPDGRTIGGSTDYKKVTRLIRIGRGYALKPGELVLGITREKITLPENICGWLNSRSRFARIGLMSHLTAPFVCPGVSNRQVLEIYNAGPRKVMLKPGAKICQMVLQECKGRAKYKGRFRRQVL